MGQINYPLLNRFGYSMNWFQIWNNNFLFSKYFTNFFLLNQVINYIFLEKITQNFYFLTNNFFKYQIDYNKYGTETMNSLINFYFLMSTKSVYTKLPFYLGKVWFFQFQGWVCVKPYIYAPKPQKKNFFIKKYKPDLNFYLTLFVFKRYFKFFFLKKNFLLKTLTTDFIKLL